MTGLLTHTTRFTIESHRQITEESNPNTVHSYFNSLDMPLQDQSINQTLLLNVTNAHKTARSSVRMTVQKNIIKKQSKVKVSHLLNPQNIQDFLQNLSLYFEVAS